MEIDLQISVAVSCAEHTGIADFTHLMLLAVNHRNIRDYFGESVALYFGFLGFYNRSLVAPAFLGFIFFIWQLAESKVDVDGIPAYAIFISLWASLFLEFWKRREAKYRVRWGTITCGFGCPSHPHFDMSFL